MKHNPRYAFIRQFVSGHGALTREEIRYLRLLLPSYHPDFVVELPLEIVILIALQLTRRDFARCLSVSKAWRERFLSDPVMAAYTIRRWPAFIDGAMNQTRFLQILSRLDHKLIWASIMGNIAPETELVTWDVTAGYQLDSRFHHPLDNPPTPYTQFRMGEDHQALTALYCSGKVACHLCGCIVVIDDLKSKTRKVLAPPSGIIHGLSMKLQALGSKLVVASMDRTIIAWDHVENKAYEKSLPCQSLKCATCDDRVAIILYGGNVVLWTPGHAIVQLDVSPVIHEPSIPLSKVKPRETLQGVFFNVHDKRTLYLASASVFGDELNARLHVTVQEFSSASHIGTYSSELADYEGPGAWNQPTLELLEYEFDLSFIIFGGRCMTRGPFVYTLFDKIERKFTTFDPNNIWTFDDNRPALPLRKSKKAAIDLDFAVRLDTKSLFYQVNALK
ncbi:hypothetical protein F5B22DRAFT_425358 [Xylaria bambusicola]|uniref:uncharacterized protein n=1 Tax=Xylaria bambusicola TaxID=326684 RepID=UPI0020075494|nr:uncharacterized protein F5B22DRAFT_425358 [Xylaria bambusicola]KAI0508298.1 hypothetical protein F5B22DRAFT_425358 [Xylaria bambusicola]